MIDLHVHSTFSDGSFTPEELVEKAKGLGVAGLALTDHDTTGGSRRFLAAGQNFGLRVLSGVEISADYSPGAMHLLGYGISVENAELEERLRWVRQGRNARNAAILNKLAALGLPLKEEEVAAFAGADVIGRPHFAQAMMARGYVRDTREAFDKYLAKGKAAYSDRQRLTPAEGIKAIRDAGGVAVLAHPWSLRLPLADLRGVVRGLRDLGLGGMEVFYPEHTAQMIGDYSALARELGLVTTGGSDFHGKTTPDIVMGRGLGSLNVPDYIFDELTRLMGQARTSP